MTVFLIFLTGCNSESIPEEMYEHLEQAVSLEEPFAEKQGSLVELEDEEKEIYDEIIELGMDDIDRIQELSTRALENIDERKEIIVTEKQSIEDAKEEFDKVNPLIEEINDESIKTKAVELTEAMEERYNAYLDLNDAYTNSLNEDEALYQLLQKEDVEEEELRSQIEAVNESYDKVIETNQLFNEKTEVYNTLKREFYELAELNVQYSE
nr:YkyA family protein [Aquibacillus albus]